MSHSLGSDRLRDLSRRLQRRLRTVSARTRYRVGIPSAAPGGVRISERFRHPVEAAASSPPARYRALFPQGVREELAETSRLAAHQFRLLGHAMDHGERIAWSRDPVSGRDWSRGFSADIPYRGAERLGDIKLPWELNKHQYFFTLGKTAWLGGTVDPALEVVRQIEQWIDDNPYQRGIHWISALESGTRAVSWIMAYPFYARCCDDAFRRRLAAALAQHLLFVEQHLSIDRFANTHLVGEAAVLVVGGLFLDCRHSHRWLARGIEILEAEIENQVTLDGVHAERSVAYHRFFLDHYYLVAALLAANQRSLSPRTLQRVEQMTTFLMHVVLPDGTVPDVGDADAARGLWLRGDAPSDYRGLLALGASLFNRGDLKAAAGGVTEEVFWLHGVDGVARFEQLTESPAEQPSMAYADSGYYVMRGGWAASDPTLLFDCGPLGFGSAGHGHADALSVQLHAAGYPFLVDAGTFSYNLDYSWRNVFRSTRAHNTVVVDGEDQSVPRDRMAWDSVAQSQLHRWVTTRWFDLADGEHDGYRRLPDPVTHRRVVAFLKPDLWLIWDNVNGRAEHELECLFHVRPDCRVEVGPAGGGVLIAPDGRRLSVSVTGSGHQELELEVLQGDEQDRDTWFSPGYGIRLPSRALRVKRAFAGHSGLITCCSTSAETCPVVAHDDESMRVDVQRGDGARETFFYRTAGLGALDAEGVHFDGTLLFHRAMPGPRPIVCARRFQALSLEGLLDISAPAMIEQLVLADEHCEVVVDADQVSHMRFSARDGVRFTINGRLQPTASSPTVSSLVTA